MTTNTIRTRANPTLNDLNIKSFLLNKEYIYRICFSSIIYLQNINISVGFDSITVFPYGLLVLCLIAMIMDKSSGALCECVLMQMFSRLNDELDICKLLYYCVPRSNRYDRILPESIGNPWNVEAVFPPDFFPMISG